MLSYVNNHVFYFTSLTSDRFCLPYLTGTSDSESSTYSSEDSSDGSSSEDSESETEDETAGRDVTEPPQGGTTDTPPEGSIASLVAGKREVVLKDMALSQDQVRCK